MKTHVTNLYGFIKDKEVASMQRKFAQTAHDMGIYELGGCMCMMFHQTQIRNYQKDLME